MNKTSHTGKYSPDLWSWACSPTSFCPSWCGCPDRCLRRWGRVARSRTRRRLERRLGATSRPARTRSRSPRWRQIYESCHSFDIINLNKQRQN